MEPEVLLAQLRALFERAPDFEEYSPVSKDHMIWLGQAHALVSRWNAIEASSFQSAADLLPIDLLRPNNIAKIFGIIHRAIADLELIVPDNTSTVFGAGEVYDIFRALNEVIASAEKSIFIIGLILGLVFLNSCSSIKVYSDVDPTVDWSKYKTFEYYGWAEESDRILNSLDRDRFETAFGEEFKARGL